MIKATLSALPTGKRHGAHCTGGCVGPSAVWTGMQNSAHIRIRSWNQLARSDSLNRLHHPDESIVLYDGIHVSVCVWYHLLRLCFLI